MALETGWDLAEWVELAQNRPRLRFVINSVVKNSVSLHVG